MNLKGKVKPLGLNFRVRILHFYIEFNKEINQVQRLSDDAFLESMIDQQSLNSNSAYLLHLIIWLQKVFCCYINACEENTHWKFQPSIFIISLGIVNFPKNAKTLSTKWNVNRPYSTDAPQARKFILWLVIKQQQKDFQKDFS